VALAEAFARSRISPLGAITIGLLCSACTGTGFYSSPIEPGPPKPKVLTVFNSSVGLNPPASTGSSRLIVEFVNEDMERHEIRSNPHAGAAATTTRQGRTIRDFRERSRSSDWARHPRVAH